MEGHFEELSQKKFRPLLPSTQSPSCPSYRLRFSAEGIAAGEAF